MYWGSGSAIYYIGLHTIYILIYNLKFGPTLTGEKFNPQLIFHSSNTDASHY